MTEESVTEDVILKERPLKNRYSYLKKPQINEVKRDEDGNLLNRSFVGGKSSYVKVEADKFLEKLNTLPIMQVLGV